MRSDVIVCGAGIVGVCTALHLQDRGRRVVLLDRGQPGKETSFGNAGIIERTSITPYGFPRDLGRILTYLGNRSSAVRYDPRALPWLLPWLWRYWRESTPAKLAQAASDLLPLISSCVTEHVALSRRAGAEALLRGSGWIEAFVDSKQFAREASAAESFARTHALRVEALAGAELASAVRGVQGGFAGALRWPDVYSTVDPGALVSGYAQVFLAGGGQLMTGDARSLQPFAEGWQVSTSQGTVEAQDAVIALGPWSGEFMRQLGYRWPLGIKRGYHMHYAPVAGQELALPVLDASDGYVLAPMRAGLRLTTGVEFATANARPCYLPLQRAEAAARQRFYLGERLDALPWLGMRPCTADMRPLIGRVPRHPGLWCCFGHNHHGLTLGPGSGRLLAELICGASTFVDARPFDPIRFG
jgi:D-amino-acid dehydrogenase